MRNQATSAPPFRNHRLQSCSPSFSLLRPLPLLHNHFFSTQTVVVISGQTNIILGYSLTRLVIIGQQSVMVVKSPDHCAPVL